MGKHQQRGICYVCRTDVAVRLDGNCAKHGKPTCPGSALRPVGGDLVLLESALDVARGCHDYKGGYSGAEYDAFQHGIDTVLRVLEANQADLQRRTVERLGRAARGSK